MSDPLDVIDAVRGTLRAAFAQATTDPDRQAIRDKINALADLQEEIILGQFMSEAAKVSALTDTLTGIIQDLRGRIANLFIDDMTRIGVRNGLLTPAPGPAGGGAAAAGPGPAAPGVVAVPPVAGPPAAVASAGGAAAAPAQGNVRGLDCAKNCSNLGATISGNGLQFVGRYYRSGKSKYPALTGAEASALSAAGLVVVALWESASDKIGHFAHSTGVDEGTSAYRQALVAGQPRGTPIYFAVDNDFNLVEIAGPILAYFQGIADGFAAIGNQSPAYAIGVYGSGLVCSTLVSHGLARYAWLAMSTGWSGYSTFDRWNIKQGKPTVDLGIDYDSDEARPGYGGFRIPG